MSCRLEDIQPGGEYTGIVPEVQVKCVAIDWAGATENLTVTYDEPNGRVGRRLIFRADEAGITKVEGQQSFSFHGDGNHFRLVAEAYRIKLAHHFDPLLAIHTSEVRPLPHQLNAVYDIMLSPQHQPLRFLLADDPGAGKTIMAGLLIKELIARGDVKRCMIVCPGSLVEQWQDELRNKFKLNFTIMTNEGLQASGENWFKEHPLTICRVHKMAWDEDLHPKINQAEWDLIICDEAHKMSASHTGGEVKYTHLFRLGELLGGRARNFLLMTATPHNGKEEDFQLFLSLLDPDRFEGKFREEEHTRNYEGLFRRAIKEDLLTFEEKRLFPERIASTLNYQLSELENRLYEEVTRYVKDQFNAADRLTGNRKVTVGFALTSLQRRLASSPEAIYRSLTRRKEKLEARLQAEKLHLRTGGLTEDRAVPNLGEEEVEEYFENPSAEDEEQESEIVDRATAAQTIAELESEIQTLRGLEETAKTLWASHTDRKWEELSSILSDNPEMRSEDGNRRKLVIFTEHKDTLNYLVRKIGAFTGRPESIVSIHGGLRREERLNSQNLFKNDPEVHFLVATDAAGEGINLQCAHLMVNYDLPWNPNRIEQRFGRIHRIGQQMVCHLWNLVAPQTREGEVFAFLLRKLEEARQALGGRVFDVLGQLRFNDRPLREVLLDAVRYGDTPEVRARFHERVEGSVDLRHFQELLDNQALAVDAMDSRRIRKIKIEMELAEARRMQPHFIESFFRAALKELGGEIYPREEGRYEITRVPAVMRSQDLELNSRMGVLMRYQRITFEKDKETILGLPQAEFVCPGNPVLTAAIEVLLQRFGSILRQGTILVDDATESLEPRALILMEHEIRDGRRDANGQNLLVSKKLQFVEVNQNGQTSTAGYAPYLDYRPLEESELSKGKAVAETLQMRRDLETKAKTHAAQSLAKEHYEEIKKIREDLCQRTESEVRRRLTTEINRYDLRAQELRLREQAGGKPGRHNSAQMQGRADELRARLDKRLGEISLMRQVAPGAPHIVGAALVLPKKLLDQAAGQVPTTEENDPDALARKEVELAAMRAVMQIEEALGFKPKDVSKDKLGWDIQSEVPATGQVRFIEVKGRRDGASNVTITKNEILASFNKPDTFFLAVVEVHPNEGPRRPKYVPRPFKREPDFGVTGVIYELSELLGRSVDPEETKVMATNV